MHAALGDDEECSPMIPTSDRQGSTLTSQDSPSVRWCLYGSYGCAAWAWRAWEFTVALLLIRLYPDSLLLVSAYGLLDNLVRVGFGSAVGSYIDRTDRVRGAHTMYIAQNVCIALSAASAAVLLIAGDSLQQAYSGALYWTLMCLTIVAGALSSVGSTGVMIAVEKRMVQALCGSDVQALSSMNAGMRAIDLTALLAAPLASGLLMTYAGVLPAVLLLAAYTLVAWVPEQVLLQMAVRRAPVLRSCQAPAVQAVPVSSDAETQLPWHHRLTAHAAVYLRQDTLLPSVGLAMLYATVLSLGFLMTSYLKWSGLTEAEVSGYRGIGAIAGLLATVIFPRLTRAIGLVPSAMLGIGMQLSCLCLGVLPVVWEALQHSAATTAGPSASVVPAGVGALRLMVAGVVCSRTGLWLYDLCVTQLQQERVDPAELGVVCGVQSSLQAAFEMLSFIAGLLFAAPEQFVWLMLASLCCVTAAAALQLTYTVRHRWSAAGRGAENAGGAGSYQQLDMTEKGSWPQVPGAEVAADADASGMVKRVAPEAL